MKSSTLINRLLAGIFILAMWQIVYFLIDVEIFKVSPLSVFLRILENFTRSEFYRDLISTLFSTLLGIVSGIILAIFMCYLSVKNNFFHEISKIFVEIIKTVPVVSFIVFFLFFISSKYLNIFIALIVTLQAVYINLMGGIEKIDRRYIFMADLMSKSIFLKFKYVYVDSLLSYFKAALSIGIGMAFKASVAAEVISHPNYGLGARIYESKIYLDLNELIAYSIFVVLLSYFVEKNTRRILDAYN